MAPKKKAWLTAADDAAGSTQKKKEARPKGGIRRWMTASDFHCGYAYIVAEDTGEARRIFESDIVGGAKIGLRRHWLIEDLDAPGHAARFTETGELVPVGHVFPSHVNASSHDVPAVLSAKLDHEDRTAFHITDQVWEPVNGWNFTVPHLPTEEAGDDPELRARVRQAVERQFAETGLPFELLALMRVNLWYFSDGNAKTQQKFIDLGLRPGILTYDKNTPGWPVRPGYRRGWSSEDRDNGKPKPAAGLANEPLLYCGPAWVIRFQLDGQNPAFGGCRVFVDDEGQFLCSDWCQRVDYTSYSRGINLQVREFTLPAWLVNSCLSHAIERAGMHFQSLEFRRVPGRTVRAIEIALDQNRVIEQVARRKAWYGWREAFRDAVADRVIALGDMDAVGRFADEWEQRAREALALMPEHNSHEVQRTLAGMPVSIPAGLVGVSERMIRHPYARQFFNAESMDPDQDGPCLRYVAIVVPLPVRQRADGGGSWWLKTATMEHGPYADTHLTVTLPRASHPWGRTEAEQVKAVQQGYSPSICQSSTNVQLVASVFRKMVDDEARALFAAIEAQHRPPVPADIPAEAVAEAERIRVAEQEPVLQQFIERQRAAHEEACRMAELASFVRAGMAIIGVKYRDQMPEGEKLPPWWAGPGHPWWAGPGHQYDGLYEYYWDFCGGHSAVNDFGGALSAEAMVGKHAEEVLSQARALVTDRDPARLAVDTMLHTDPMWSEVAYGAPPMTARARRCCPSCGNYHRLAGAKSFAAQQAYDAVWGTTIAEEAKAYKATHIVHDTPCWAPVPPDDPLRGPVKSSESEQLALSGETDAGDGTTIRFFSGAMIEEPPAEDPALESIAPISPAPEIPQVAWQMAEAQATTTGVGSESFTVVVTEDESVPGVSFDDLVAQLEDANEPHDEEEEEDEEWENEDEEAF